MTSVLAKLGLCAAMAGMTALMAPGAALAGGPTNRDQGTAMFDAGAAPGLSAESAAVAIAVEGIAALLSIPTSPAVVAALQALREVLETAGPGSPAAAQAVSEALAVIVTPEVAANPPPLSADQTETAVALLSNIIAGLSAHGAPVPPAVVTLSSVLQARLS